MKMFSMLLLLVFLVILTPAFSHTPDEYQGLLDAIEDAEPYDASNYWVTGCLFGIAGWMIDINDTPPIPINRMIGKSALYINSYTTEYYKRIAEKRENYLTTGCLCNGWFIATTTSIILTIKNRTK